MNQKWLEDLTYGGNEFHLDNGLVVTVKINDAIKERGLFCRVFEAKEGQGGYGWSCKDALEYCCVMNEIASRDPPFYNPNPNTAIEDQP